MTTIERHAFIDWLKCLGMVVIVFGHVAGWAPLNALAPIAIKQLGVACFLFALGYTLVRDGRPWQVVIFRRVFEVFLIGLSLAVVLSAAGLALGGRIAISNYLPFFLGANVLFNFFPANPTSWYIGTYVHLVLVGTWLLRGRTLTIPVLTLALAIEVLVRAAILATGATMVAYMVAPNWCLVFLAGAYCGQNGLVRVGDRWWKPAGALTLFLGVWWVSMQLVPLRSGFPFMMPVQPGVLPLVWLSGLVSVLYLATTLLTFATVTHAPRLRPVEFISRNTLIVFLGHMPLYYALLPVLPVDTLGRGGRSAILMLVCLVGLAWLSEGVHALVDVPSLRDRILARLTDRLDRHRDRRAPAIAG